MIDAHAHIERGPYTQEWIERFVERGQAAGIHELRLLEHSSRFQEFRQVYRSVEEHPQVGGYQSEWLNSKCVMRLADYQQLVSETRSQAYPVALKFGLEVCYFPEYEREIGDIVGGFDWDFLTGSIHWIDGFGFDHEENIPIWRTLNVDRLYRRYYELILQCIESGIFDVIAHPDSIKCFGFYPSEDMGSIYEEVAWSALAHGTSLEFSNGLHLNYGHHELGPNRQFLGILQQHGVHLLTASDAHRPEDVGRYIREAEEILANTR
jgi:histidinol-phosphatase (PHP family)